MLGRYISPPIELSPRPWILRIRGGGALFQIYANGIPNTAIGGVNKPIIHFDNSYITYDDDCPSGELYGLNLDYWVFEIMSGHNFVWTGFTDKSRTEEGGEYIEWGDFDLIARLTCRAPWKGVARVANLTSSQ